MSLKATGPRIMLAALLAALVLFLAAFLIARGSSSQAALPSVREAPVSGSPALKHARLGAIGPARALPRPRRKAKPKSTPKASPNRSTPPPVVAPPPAPPAAPPPPPPPPPPPCLGEVC